MNTIATHYIDGPFVESHGLDVMDITNPTNGRVITKVTLADEEDVLSVITCQDDEDEIRIANDTEYGLQRARRVASQIQAGRAATTGTLGDQQAPFNGFKHSGEGREFGLFGFEASLESVAILE